MTGLGISRRVRPAARWDAAPPLSLERWLVGRSRAMVALRRTIERVARSEVPVLIARSGGGNAEGPCCF